MFLSTGAFVRGSFVSGHLHGSCYIRPTSDYAYLMKFEDGLLNDFSSVFDFHNDQLRVLKFQEGKFHSFAKKFDNKTEKCHNDLTVSFFGRDIGEVDEFIKLTNEIKTKQGTFIGSFALSRSVWYYGAFSNGAPNGLGVLIEAGNRVYMGYFENGQLSGFGRSVWPNGAVIDGIIRKGAFNEHVIVYDQCNHQWTEAVFTDNMLVEESEKDDGYPRNFRKELFGKYFTRPYEKAYNVEIPPQIFSEDVSQEVLFLVIYGEKFSEDKVNHLQFRLSGDKKIEFDSRKDIDEIKKASQNSKQSNISQSFKESPEGARSQTASLTRTQQSKEDTPQQRSIPGSRQGTPASKSPNRVTTDPGKGENAQYNRAQSGNQWGQDGSNILADDNYGPGDKSSGGKHNQSDHKHSFTKGLYMDPNKIKYPTPQFDKYDMLILQRSLNWDNDKTLNSKNKFSRKTLSSKGISDETKINIIKNYVEDFMENYMDRKTIDSLMEGVEAYKLLKAKQGQS